MAYATRTRCWPRWRGRQQPDAYGSPPPDAADLVSAYAYGLARGHGFSDGNKRTAWLATRLFLTDNGCTLRFD